jgi:HD superfamily phosphohydrolase
MSFIVPLTPPHGGGHGESYTIDSVPLSQTDHPQFGALPYRGSGRWYPHSNAHNAILGPDESMSGSFELDLRPPTGQVFPKIIHDRVHDQITFHPLIMEIMDTVEFQRLRGLHQLGNCRYLFPGATNTRFEHSLGVAHLAMHMAKILRDNHETVKPRLDISERDILCLGIAGLCHDLGHGPFSHMFEDFVNKARQRRDPNAKHWHHEEGSVQLLDYLIRKNNIDLGRHGLRYPEDLNFIKQLIEGLKPSEPWPIDIGRTESQRYLFDIVANKRNGIDVDKLDYFLRDSMSCYGKLPDIHVDRIFKCARVIDCEGQRQICFQEKVALSLGELFSLRAKLHKYVYQHRVVKALDAMVEDALLEADDDFRIEGSDGRKVRMSECVDDMEIYSKLGDWVLDAIFNTSDPKLAKARDLITRIRQRHLYDLVGYYSLSRPRDGSAGPPPPVIKVDDLLPYLPAESREHAKTAVFVSKLKIVYGSSGSQPGDPVDHVRFYNPKQSQYEAFPLPPKRFSPLFTPTEFVEETILVFTRDPELREQAWNAFKAWKNHTLKNHAEAVPSINASPAKQGRKRVRMEDPPKSDFSQSQGPSS